MGLIMGAFEFQTVRLKLAKEFSQPYGILPKNLTDRLVTVGDSGLIRRDILSTDMRSTGWTTHRPGDAKRRQNRRNGSHAITTSLKNQINLNLNPNSI